jgi:ATP-dependent Clp protease ATP-binding subunit ClpC
MYAGWAAKRRLQLDEFVDETGHGPPILQIHGFGAYRTLAAEAGLHVLDDAGIEAARRIAARVTVVPGPPQDLPKEKRYQAARTLLAAPVPGSNIVRRYREQPAPLVRDVAKGWRTGRLDAVLTGDFDLIGAESNN